MPALDNLTRAAEISFTVARRAGPLVLSAIRQVAGVALNLRPKRRSHPSPPPPPPSQDAAPDHVDREAVVVAESADPGAGDGAGAQIRIAEPWKGYGKLTAKEVNDRLATESQASLAVARLYEAAHRNRVTVLREIDRRLAAAAS